MVAVARTLTLSILLTVALCCCAPRPTSLVLKPVSNPPSTTKKVRILVATTRERGIPGDDQGYGAGRASSVNYGSVTVSIPKHHKVGMIEWPDTLPGDPSQHFVATERTALTKTDFLQRVQSPGTTVNSDAGSVLVFVHGYNTLYEEAVYRFAQIVHDSGFSGSAVLFAWPSRGKAPLYLADRDASTYSRDYLEQTIDDIAAQRGVKEVNILAHSMGTWLTVETLRQAKMHSRLDFRGKLGDVILASPDIDLGVFRTQLEVIGPLRRPLTVMVSGDDKALALSTTLAGGVYRAGQVTMSDPKIAQAAITYNLRIIDLTKVSGDASSNHHTKFAESGAVIAAIGRGLASDGTSGQAQPGVVTAITDIGDSLLKIPATLIGGMDP